MQSIKARFRLTNWCENSILYSILLSVYPFDGSGAVVILTKAVFLYGR